MPLTVIHGEDQVKTRQELSKLIQPAAVHLDGKSVTLETMIQNLESGNMFDESVKQIVIEDLHKKRSKTELKEIVDYLAATPSSHDVILWESKELTATDIKKLGSAKVITAKLSPLIFKLTDSLSPRTSLSTILPLLHDSCQTDSPEMVLVMLGRQIRLMIATFDLQSKMAPWQRGKLTSIAKLIGMEKLLSLHHRLAEIDFKNKTGQLPVDLTSELQLWLTKLYQ